MKLRIALLTLSLLPTTLYAGNCEVRLATLRSSVSICLSKTGGGAPTPENASFFVNSRIDVACEEPLASGVSQFILTADSVGLETGFTVREDGSGNPIPGTSGNYQVNTASLTGASWGSPRAPISDTFVSKGKTLARTLIFTYQGGATTSQTLNLSAQVARAVTPSESSEVDINAELLDDPSDGTSTTNGPQMVNVEPCRTSPVTLFFPYVPAVKAGFSFTADACAVTPGDWALLSYTNQGSVPAGDILATIFEEDGSEWSAAFPELPVRGHASWKLYDDGSDVFFEHTTTGERVDLVRIGGNSGKLDSPSSMFLSSSTVITFVNDVFNGDLDGFFQLGRDRTIHSSYLPRNYDNDIPNQNADLPLQRN